MKRGFQEIAWLVGRSEPRQLQVLQALRDGRVTRGSSAWRSRAHLLEGRSVNWTISALAVRGYRVFQRVGPALVTPRGMEVLDGPN
jgi:hypothetical protein